MMLNNLNDISFVETSPTNIEKDIITTYEAISGKKLYQGDPVRLYLQAIAAIIIQQRILIDYSAKQNLLSYAEGDTLDHVVALVGVTRLNASPARTTLRFTISAPQQAVINVPKNTKVKAGELYFVTTTHEEIAIGETQIDISAECLEVGTKGNNLIPGQITSMVDIFPFYLNVSNITTTTGGTDIEDDEALRERAFEAPNSFSNAGSDDAYAFWAKTVSPEIGDVAVISPSPGEVEIIPIGKQGQILSDELIEAILIKCSDKNVKPLTDHVAVITPTVTNYDIRLRYYLSDRNKAISASLQGKIAVAIDEYILWQGAKLGRDINPSELIYRIIQAGAKRVEIESPVFLPTSQKELARVQEIEVIYGGLEDE